MALQSKLFKGDPKLEACEVHDAAHLTLGAQGLHVAKVQSALFALDSLRIDRSELLSQKYGPSTAQAVLAYKTRRQIINFAYQKLNSENLSLDHETLLHEMIHAALPRELARLHDPERFSVFFEFGRTQLGDTNRSVLKPERAAALSNGFFAI